MHTDSASISASGRSARRRAYAIEAEPGGVRIRAAAGPGTPLPEAKEVAGGLTAQPAPESGWAPPAPSPPLSIGLALCTARTRADPAPAARSPAEAASRSPSRAGRECVLETSATERLVQTDRAWRWERSRFTLTLRQKTCRGRVRLDAATPPDERPLAAAAALERALTALLPRGGRYPLHGAGLSRRGGAGVLLVGPSGSGKSTLAAGLVRAGWRCLSDDVMVLMPPGKANGWRACGLTRGIRLCPDAWKRLGFGPEDRGAASRVRESASRRGRRKAAEKNVLPEAERSRTPPARPRWLLFPEITGRRRSALEALRAPAATRRLLAQMHPTAALPDAAAQSQLRAAAALAGQCRCRVLKAGADLRDRPRRLARLL